MLHRRALFALSLLVAASSALAQGYPNKVSCRVRQ